MNAELEQQKQKLVSLLNSTLEKRNMTPQEFADELKEDISKVRRWLRGVNFPNDTMMCKIASELDMGIHELYALVR